MIACRDVSFSYPASGPVDGECLTEGALKHITCTIEDGSFVLLCGASGCGKTTVTKLINGLIPAFTPGCRLEGRVMVDGIAPRETPMYELAQRVGSVFQNPKSQFFNLDTDSELAFGLENEGHPPEEIRRRVEQVAETLHLQDLRGKNIFSLSGGQKQLLAFGSVYAMGPELYVLDEPSIGLHPSNIEGLTDVMHDLVADGNSVVLVDHDTQILKEADWLIEMGREAGAKGGHVIAQGSIPKIEQNAASQIGPFLAGRAGVNARPHVPENELFAQGRIHLATSAIHTVKPLELELPKGRLTVVTGVSGSGKTTLILESLVPALQAKVNGTALPAHVKSVEAEEIAQVKLIDATPIGINVRSTVATYANVHDELRKKFAATPDARQAGYKAGDFSYNTGKLRCPVCDGTGSISLDVQFLPDVEIPCPECRGSRYAKEAGQIFYTSKSGTRYSLPQLMDTDVNTALTACADWPVVRQRLTVLQELGLGYLTLGEETPGLSGGEAQRLKLASEMGKAQSDSLFVFDEPPIGLPPADVQVLLGVFQTLIEHGATVIVIEHDLDVIRNADYIIDMGPGGGAQGGTVVAAGTPDVIRHTPASQTGKFI